MRKTEFLDICSEEKLCEHTGTGIGTYKEKRLHAVLKKYIDRDTSHHEIPMFGSVADIFDGDRIVEIQTGSLRPLREKLEKYTKNGYYDIEVVCPIAEKKWIAWIDAETGEATEKRRSPKKGRASDIIPEIYYLLDFIPSERLKLHLVMLEVEEYRMLNGWSRDKKKGSTRYERIPIDILGEIELTSSEDYDVLIPSELEAEFNSADFKRATRLSQRKTSYSLKTLTLMGLIERVGKKGNSYVYKKTSADT